MQKYIALSYPDFRILWISVFISNIGSQMQIVAINWHIYTLTHSAIALGTIGLMRFIPIIFASLPGGSFADTHNRKKILIYTQISLMSLSFLLSILTYFNAASELWIYIITILSAIAISFDLPARQAFIPQLVKKEHLTNAISLNTIMFQVSFIVGPAIAGFLLGKYGVTLIYAINTISYIFIIASLFLIKAKGEVIGEKSTVSIKAIKEGFEFVTKTSIISSTMLLDFFCTFFSSATALLPIFATDILKVGPTELGFLYAGPAIGSLIAGFIMTHLPNLRNQGKILLYACSLYAVATILFGFSKMYWLSLFALILVGLGDGISAIIRNAIRQLKTPDSMRGRMIGVNMIFFLGGPQLGEFEAGIIAYAIGAPLSVITGGIGTLIAIATIAVIVPTLRRYDTH